MIDYTTLSAVKSYLRITTTADDTLLSAFITRASRMIDDHCGRWFSAETQIRKFDAVGRHISGSLLFVDADLLTITSLINGDGARIPSNAYVLRPSNFPPYFGVSLLASSGLYWNHTGDPENAISISGTWGYSAATPDPVGQAAIRLAAWLYRQRDTGAEPVGEVQVTERGVAVAPARLPRDVADLLMPYIRARMSFAV